MMNRYGFSSGTRWRKGKYGRGARQTKAASIKDVAALAQVSVPTVSRYLNDRERVSDEKCEKIAKAIENARV